MIVFSCSHCNNGVGFRTNELPCPQPGCGRRLIGKCTSCGILCGDLAILIPHFLSCFRCSRCDMRFETALEMYTHWDEVHMPRRERPRTRRVDTFQLRPRSPPPQQ